MDTRLKEVRNIIPGISEKQEGRLYIWVEFGHHRHMREMLASEVFGGRPIRWLEGDGFFTRKFEVAGPLEHLQQMEKRIQHWAGCLQQISMM